MEKILEIKRRFFRKEKNRFLEAIEEKLTEYGYSFKRKDFGFLVHSTNLETETETNQPEYIFIAHYDTGTIMPFWFTWLMKLFGVNYQILMIVFIFIFFKASAEFHYLFDIVYAIFLLSCLSMFIPNPKNLDDNTSGVITLLQLAKKFKEKGIENVKFIFVDNEELGMFGSRAHKRYLKKNKMITPNCRIISIDCVGAGKIPLLLRNSKSDYAESFYKEFLKDYENCKSVRTIVPLSDNYSFKNYGAFNISFANKAIMPNGYTLSKIHTPTDNNIDINQIEKLTDVLTKVICKENQINTEEILETVE